MIDVIKTRLFLDYMNKDWLATFGKPVEKGLRGELGNILELRTGYICNNNCMHCPVIDKKHLKDRTTADCKKILKNNRRNRSLLILSGGEPTIRKDIFDLISYARDLDYQWIQLKTNGRMFSSKDFTEKMVRVIGEHPVSSEQREANDKDGYNFGGLDIFEFYITLFAHNPELHDSITRVPESFEQTTQGIKNLLRLNQLVVANILITKLNYECLPETVRYLDSLGINFVEFSLVNPIGSAPKFKNIMPKISNVQPYLFKAIEESLKAHKWPHGLINSIPACCIGEYQDYLSERFYPYDRHAMYKLVDLNSTETYYEEQSENNVKAEKCKCCIYDPICFGLNKAYAEIMGINDLKPIFGSMKPLVEKNKISLFKNLQSIQSSDLKLEFDDLKLKANFTGTKADVIVLLSGGVDSTLAAAMYAKKNKNKKIVLVTFCESYSPGTEVVSISANHLMKRHKNIVKYFIVPIPYIVSKKFVFEGLEEVYKKFNFYITCRRCKFLRLTYCIYLHKKYFDGNIIIDGMKGGEGGPTKIYTEYLSEYGIKFFHPLKSILEKKKVIELIKHEGLPIQQKNVACLLSSLKTRLNKPKPISQYRATLHKEKDKFTALLEHHNIYKNK